MANNLKFSVQQKIPGQLGRAGLLETPHGVIQTPAFVTVGTKATIKALTPEQVKNLGAQVVLANTYHLYLEPGAEIVAQAGGLHKFMNWPGPTITDSGGFQVFSLGAAYGEGGVSKFNSPLTKGSTLKMSQGRTLDSEERLAKIDEDGVTFRSHLDGSEHRFTPESSIKIQRQLGADIIFAFDECTSPQAGYEYQQEAMARTHAWAERSLAEFKKDPKQQSLFGIVQGGRHRDLREESARFISSLDFDGFGIGGSFSKEDLQTAVGWVNTILPPDKPRHLLGIGTVEDLFAGVEAGCDTFDCVAPTRMARNGTLETKQGRINLLNAKYKDDFSPLESDCGCYTCQSYTKAYLAHLFRSKEMLAATLASIHNLYFYINLVSQMRVAILTGQFDQFKYDTLKSYGSNFQT